MTRFFQAYQVHLDGGKISSNLFCKLSGFHWFIVKQERLKNLMFDWGQIHLKALHSNISEVSNQTFLGLRTA